jgi:hypothetical protein
LVSQFQFIVLVFIAKAGMLRFTIVSKEFRFAFTFAQLIICFCYLSQVLVVCQILAVFKMITAPTLKIIIDFFLHTKRHSLDSVQFGLVFQIVVASFLSLTSKLRFGSDFDFMLAIVVKPFNLIMSLVKVLSFKTDMKDIAPSDTNRNVAMVYMDRNIVTKASDKSVIVTFMDATSYHAVALEITYVTD